MNVEISKWEGTDGFLRPRRKLTIYASATCEHRTVAQCVTRCRHKISNRAPAFMQPPARGVIVSAAFDGGLEDCLSWSVRVEQGADRCHMHLSTSRIDGAAKLPKAAGSLNMLWTTLISHTRIIITHTWTPHMSISI
jgi:hypothetical protein